jgi:hypothetical protein
LHLNCERKSAIDYLLFPEGKYMRKKQAETLEGTGAAGSPDRVDESPPTTSSHGPDPARIAAKTDAAGN